MLDMTKFQKRFNKRNKNIVSLRKKGLTLAEIGEIHGLTRERVRQIVEAVNKLLDTKPD